MLILSCQFGGNFLYRINATIEIWKKEKSQKVSSINVTRNTRCPYIEELNYLLSQLISNINLMQARGT